MMEQCKKQNSLNENCRQEIPSPGYTTWVMSDGYRTTQLQFSAVTKCLDIDTCSKHDSQWEGTEVPTAELSYKI